MNIRPHHLLCVQNYIGYGYNEEFRLHMDDTTKKLAKDPEVVIHEGCDDICTACPYDKDGTCTSLDKVDRMDSKVLLTCGLEYGDKRKWKDLTSLARKEIFDTDRFHEICGKCQWFDICQKRLAQINRIERFEKIMQEVKMSLDRNAGQDKDDLRDAVKKLENYYESDEWKEDYAADEKGLLPKDLKRGVLSEDGLYDLLDRYRSLCKKE